MKKSFWSTFPPIIKCDKPQGTVSNSPEASLTITVEKLRSFLQDLRSCWKQNFWKRKATFPVKKRFWPFYSLFLEHTIGHGTFFEGPQGLFDKYFPNDKNFSLGPMMSIARTFSKQKINCSHGDKSFWLTFHRNTNCHKTPGTVYNCTQCFWHLLWNL